MNRRLASRFRLLLCALLAAISCGSGASEQEPFHLWLEAESFLVDGKDVPDAGHPYWAPDQLEKLPGWRIAGPGVVAEWSQGGESEWNSIGARPSETNAVISERVELSRGARYRVWVRYSDYQAADEVFRLVIRDGDKTFLNYEFGAQPVVYERDEFKQYWGKTFAWDHADVVLPKGRFSVELRIDKASRAPRQVDCLLLTDDLSFVPDGRSKPAFAFCRYLSGVQRGVATPSSLVAPPAGYGIGGSWARKPFAGRDFVMAYNVVGPAGFWQQDTNLAPGEKVLFPYSVDAKLVSAFEKQYAGRKDVPIFSSPLIAPVIHISNLGEHLVPGAAFHDWLVETGKPFFILVNYGRPAWDEAASAAVHTALTQTLSKQWLGFIAGEAFPYFPPQVIHPQRLDGEPSNEAEAKERKRLESLVEMQKLHGQLQASLNRLRMSTRPQQAAMSGELVSKLLAVGSHSSLGQPIDNLISKSVSCLSAGHVAYSHLLREWGAQMVGSEHSAVMPNYGMRLAFQRGAARQYGGWWTFYNAPNFGDTATTFGAHGAPTYYYWSVSRYGPEGGPSITWYRKSLFHQYMSGMTVMYHEQGGDQFFQPQPGNHPVMLNPLGKVTDEFLRFAAAHPDRGVTYTPLAFLLDINHGWSLNRYHGGYMGGAFPETEADRAIRGMFDIAYYPHPVTEGEPATADRQAFVSGTFGEMFDVLVTSPGQRQAVRDYEIVVALGDVVWTKEWVDELMAHVRAGATLVLNAAQVSPLWPEAFIGARVVAENHIIDDGSVVLRTGETLTGTPYRLALMQVAQESEIEAWTSQGVPVLASCRQGRGRLVLLAMPHGMSLDRRPHPLLAWLMAQLTSARLPVAVEGDVQYLVNRNSRGWVVTLINNRGVYKPQLGLARLDRRESARVTLRTQQPVRSSSEWISGRAIEWKPEGAISQTSLVLPVCGIEIIEVMTK